MGNIEVIRQNVFNRARVMVIGVGSDNKKLDGSCYPILRNASVLLTISNLDLCWTCIYNLKLLICSVNHLGTLNSFYKQIRFTNNLEKSRSFM